MSHRFSNITALRGSALYRSAALALAFSVSLALCADPTPAERFQALLKEAQSAPDAKLPSRFLELAEQNPNDPVAIEALIQTVAWVNSSAYPAGGKDSPGTKALAILQRDHVGSGKIGIACQHVAFGFHQSHEDFLRAVLKTNPHRDIQGLATLSLAQFLFDRLNRLELLKDQPELTERYHRVFGKAFMDELQRQDRTVVVAEAEALFVRAAEKHPDVVIPVTYYGSGGTVGEKAQRELFQIRHLAVGRLAPEIEGEDQDGKPFKLSDYRGKVVLIDFWHRL